MKVFGRGESGASWPPFRVSAGTLAIWGVVLLAVLVAYRDVWPWLLTEWRDNPYYSHGALVPVLSLFLIWLSRRRATSWLGSRLSARSSSRSARSS